jgi:hypothetical protein
MRLLRNKKPEKARPIKDRKNIYKKTRRESKCQKKK